MFNSNDKGQKSSQAAIMEVSLQNLSPLRTGKTAQRFGFRQMGNGEVRDRSWCKRVPFKFLKRIHRISVIHKECFKYMPLFI